MKILLFALGIFALASSALAFTVVQTSTSAGYYQDYFQVGHYPVYHSWSVNGFYDNGTEANLEFYLNNDFTVNQWLFLPTQAQFNIPLSGRFEEHPERQSKLKVGRQIFVEGFDFTQLDGIEMPIYLSMDNGVMPLFGYLQSPDPDQNSNYNTPIAGLVSWQRLAGIQLREGYTARQSDFSVRYLFASMGYQFEKLPWMPMLFAKEEVDGQTFIFNQAVTSLALNFSDQFSGRVAYAN